MDRSAHLLTALRGAVYPLQWIAVDCTGDAAPELGWPGAVREYLSSWTGCYTRRKGAEYPPSVHCQGTDAHSFWARVDIALSRGGVTWLFAERVTRVLSLLGLWEMIEDGRARIGTGFMRYRRSASGNKVPGVSRVTRADDRRLPDGGVDHLSGVRQHHADPAESHGGGVPQAGRGRYGSAILEDPPIVLELARLTLPGTLRVVDIANYGVLPSATVSDALSRVSRVDAFVRSMVYILQTEQLGSLRNTVSSQAMVSYRTAHLDTPVVCHDDARALRIEGESYYGGRCEAFRLGVLPSPVYHLDVSAMYTSICADAQLPAVFCGYSERPTDYDLPALLRTHQVIARVGIVTEQNDYPYRSAKLGITIWPSGSFKTTLAGPELMHAWERGRVKRVYSMAWYRPYPMLQSYARHILRMRTLYGFDRDVLSWIKMLGNCIVGKLGQRSRAWVDDTWRAYHEVWDSWWSMDEEDSGGPLLDAHGNHLSSSDGIRHSATVRWRSIAGHTQREIVTGLSYDAVPAVASWVCSSARSMLLSMIEVAGDLDVYYTDTDALMVSYAGYSRLRDAGFVRANTPGYLRVKRVSERVKVYGIKHYEEDGVLTCAGLSAPSVGVSGVAPGHSITPRLKGAMRARSAPVARTVRVPFHPRCAYRHAQTRMTGEVWPWSLNEEL